MKILIADKFEDVGLKGLQALGAELAYDPTLKEESLHAKIREFEPTVLVVRSTVVTGAMMEGSSLRLVVRAGAGYNTIDVQTATRLGIVVANCPGKNSKAVAELTFGLILAIDRKIPDCVAEIRAGRWDKKRFSQARGLYGRRLGVIGVGHIGREVVHLAHAFGLSVVGFSKPWTDEEARELGVDRVEDLLDLAAQADIVTVHVDLNSETRGMIGESFFAAMKRGAYFINTSRAEVVDQAALERALVEKDLFAGLDVFEGEPKDAQAPYTGSLKDNPRVYCTHHIGASTEQAQEAVAEETVRIVREFMATGVAPNAVNAA